MKKSILKKATIMVIVLLVAIQFFKTKENISTQVSENTITQHYDVPENIQNILKTSCYDCHSNNTAYPWYNNIQPVAWWLKHHVDEGKREINFNEFASYAIRRQYKKLEEIAEQVKEDEMPLSSYTLIHTNAKLNAEQKTLLINWAEEVRKEIAGKYPADSLIKK